jgi:hypothetical protein
MSNQRKRDEWMRDVAENQRNIVFPDTTRNLGGFWRGIDRQRLNTALGLFILLLFYIALIVGLITKVWPDGLGSFWQKLFYGYVPYLLFSLPLVLFFVLMRWRIRRATLAPRMRKSP